MTALYEVTFVDGTKDVIEAINEELAVQEATSFYDEEVAIVDFLHWI